MDGLLACLKSAGVGCYIGHVFTGAIAYADDIALQAPSVRAMRQMLKICEQYASGYDVVFNASKSKCIVSHPQAHRGRKTVVSTVAISFYNISMAKGLMLWISGLIWVMSSAKMVMISLIY